MKGGFGYIWEMVGKAVYRYTIHSNYAAQVRVEAEIKGEQKRKEGKRETKGSL